MAYLTVFTPTYNRAHTLGRTYKSLCDQKCKDFIWLIVDDGSTDSTADLVKEWQQECGFEIQYIYKENGGMHTAHNIAYANVHTELNVCIDSDDKMSSGAVAKIKSTWEQIKEKNYAGIIALDSDFEENIIGTGFQEGVTETTLGDYYAAGGRGDKKLIYRTDVINSVPEYPVFPDEKYVGLVYKYTLIDQKYKLYILNDVVCEVEYQSDGSSGTMWKQYLQNPKGFAFLRKTAMQYPTSRKRLVMDCIHYCSSSQIAKNRDYIKDSPRKLLTLLCTPLGWILTYIVKIKINKNMKKIECEQYAQDYYRMTGERYKKNIKSFIKRRLYHNLQFSFWYRKYLQKKTIIARGMLYRLSRKYGLEISPKAQIGEGLYLGHPYNITVGEECVLGKNVNLNKGCTIGSVNRGNVGSPILGNCVFVGINATIVGKIKIGDDVLIAPNSYVNFDVPDHSVVIGNPGVMHSRKNATEGYISFKV